MAPPNSRRAVTSTFEPLQPIVLLRFPRRGSRPATLLQKQPRTHLERPRGLLGGFFLGLEGKCSLRPPAPRGLEILPKTPSSPAKGVSEGVFSHPLWRRLRLVPAPHLRMRLSQNFPCKVLFSNKSVRELRTCSPQRWVGRRPSTAVTHPRPSP